MFDQTTLFMIFMMLCFAGMASMLYFVLRGIDALVKGLRLERNQLLVSLQSIESNTDLLVKSAQISLQRQASKGDTNIVEKESAITEKWEEDLAALQSKRLAMMETKVTSKSLTLHSD